MFSKLMLPVALAAGLIGQAALAGCGEGGCADDCCLQDGCSDGCCEKTCVLKPEVVQEEKHCWCTESKEICIPKVVCPWDKGGSGLTLFSWLKKGKKGSSCCDTTGCCDPYGQGCCDQPCSADCKKDPCGCDPCACALPRCGKIKRVCDLRKEKYEVDVCKWQQDKDACGMGCCGNGCCCEPSCGAATGCCVEPNCGCEAACEPGCGLQMCGDACGCGN